MTNRASEKHEQKKAVAAELNRLAKNGRLTPDMVIEAASDPNSPLHRYFEWDNGVAAHKYRQDQARTLINSVNMTVKTETHTMSVNVWVRDPEAFACEQGYVATTKLRTKKAAALEAVLYEFNRAEASMERVRGLAKYLQVNISGLEDAWKQAKESIRYAAETEEIVEAE